MAKRKNRFFTLDSSGGRWRLIDPAGRPFFSLGVDCVTPSSVENKRESLIARYGNGGDWMEKWADAKVRQVADMGFNTLGAWHHPIIWGRTDMPKTVEIRMSRSCAKVNTTWGFGFPDVFDPSFDESIHMACVDALYQHGGKRLLDDPSLLGWYSDNELHWWGADGYWGGDDQGTASDSTGLVDDYIALKAEKPGKRRWVQFIKERYGTIRKLNAAWETEYASLDDLHHIHHYRAKCEVLAADKSDFLRLIAETYFQKTTAAMELYGMKQLHLGTRVVCLSTPEVVLEVMAKYVDVISLNTYSMAVPEKYLAHIHELTGRPIMITEFSFCAGAQDGFLHNTNGANSVLVSSQARRCELYDQFVRRAAELPFIVGTHWFALYDYGHRDGLIGNYGLLTMSDEPWKALCAAVTKTNKNVLKNL